jgi:hypothetical protein
MRTAYLASIALALCAVAVPAMTQDVAPFNRTVYRAGNWYVVRTTKTTGAVSCTGFHMSNPGVQLHRDSLIVKLAGEPKSVGLRFGQEPARAPRPAEKAEQQMGAVVLSGADFAQLRHGKTLVLEVATAKGAERQTLQLDGLEATLKNIDAGCPVPVALQRAERAERRAREKALAERCSPASVARMRERGLNELRIASRCPNASPPESKASAPAAAPAASAASARR